MIILKSLIMSSLLFSFSLRDAKKSNVNDYEFMVAAEHKNYYIEIEKERQNNYMFDYQEIKIHKDFNTYGDIHNVSLYFLNNEEDNINLSQFSLSRKLKYIDIGVAALRYNFDYINPSLILKYSHKKIIEYEYSLYPTGYIHNLILKYSYKITNNLNFVPKYKLFKTNNNDNFSFKLELEYKLK